MYLCIKVVYSILLLISYYLYLIRFIYISKHFQLLTINPLLIIVITLIKIY